MEEAPTEAAADPGRSGIPAWVLLLLASLVLFAVFLNLEPLLTFGAWGSDSGEYATLTRALLGRGSFELSGYTGWGFAYPYFPGIFEVGAGVAAVSGTDPLLALEIAVPVLGALGAVPFYLFFRRLYPSDTVALLASALVACCSLRIFVLSHAAPLTVGDLLWAASLWALVAQRKDPRWMALLALSAGGLIITHHLSSYFFLLSALGLVLGLELFRPGLWSRRFPLREFAFLGVFTGVLFAYWLDYAAPFARILVEGLPGGVLALAPVAGVGLVVIGALVVHLRRTWARRRTTTPAWWHVKMASHRRFARDSVTIGALLFGGLALLFFVPLPGTQDYVSPLDFLWFGPVLLYAPLAASGKGIAPLSRLGPAGHLLVLAIGLSAIFGLATNNSEIAPDRHPEYLLVPLAFIAAIVLGNALARLRVEAAPWAYTGALVAVGALVLASAGTAYPPPAVLEGFQEGFTVQDTSLVAWMAAELPHGASLGADHRLSDLYFYEARSPATWDNATCLFIGSNSYCAYAELHNSSLPNPPPPSGNGPPQGPIDAVAIDQVMRVNGVALDPSLPASPMSETALHRLEGAGFVLLYVQGDQAVYWVDLPAVPAPT